MVGHTFNNTEHPIYQELRATDKRNFTYSSVREENVLAISISKTLNIARVKDKKYICNSQIVLKEAVN